MKIKVKIFFPVLCIAIVTGALLTVVIEHSMYIDTKNKLEIAEREEAERIKILEDIAADKEEERLRSEALNEYGEISENRSEEDI